MSKKLVRDVALIATKLHEAGLTFEDAQLASEYCLLEDLRVHIESPVRHVDKSAIDILWQGFAWCETPEGHTYWSELASRLSGESYEH